MYWLDAYRLAEIHRETYVAILRSRVPHGKRDEFARQCGITREYFSCLCALDDPLDGHMPFHKRHPSSQLARKIAAVLPAPNEIKHSLVENIELAHINSIKARYGSQKTIDHQLLFKQLSDLKQAHQQATFGKDLVEVRRAYHIVRDASKDLLYQVDPEGYPDSFIQLCLYYHDAQCILNRPDEALLYAKLAQLVWESIDDIEPGYTREDRDNLQINTIRGEAVAYHNLRLDRLVPDILLNRASHTSAYRNAGAFWEPFVMRDFINALAEIPRFSIREVNKVAQQIEAICERKSDEFTLLLVRESWLRALIRHEKMKQAQRIFRTEIERLPHLPYVGALHRALLLKSGAELAWKLRDIKTWEGYITEAVSLTEKAGLLHQLDQIKHSYRSSLRPIMEDLGMPYT
jgi:hypothetical protein